MTNFRNDLFEAWFVAQGYPENDLEHDHIGSYYSEKTRNMWDAWRAAISSHPSFNADNNYTWP